MRRNGLILVYGELHRTHQVNIADMLKLQASSSPTWSSISLLPRGEDHYIQRQQSQDRMARVAEFHGWVESRVTGCWSLQGSRYSEMDVASGVGVVLRGSRMRVWRRESRGRTFEFRKDCDCVMKKTSYWKFGVRIDSL